MDRTARFDKLFEPVRVGTMTVKNRVIIPPLEKSFCTYDGLVTQRYLDYVEARAKGSFGL